jgi:hypothetical protein
LNTREYEAAIVRQLEKKIAQVPAEPYPDNPQSYRLKHSAGVLLVRYDGARYAESRVEGLVQQERQLRFQVVIVSRNLRGQKAHHGAYEMLDAVRAALTGYVPEGETNPLFPVRESFISEVGGIWQYGIEFALNTVYTELTV